MSAPLLRLRPAALDWRVIDDEVVMLDASGRSTWRRTAPGRCSGGLLQEGATRAQLVDALVAQ